MADWSRGAPILLLCLARPEFLDSRPGWAGGKLNATTALLEPLQDEECERLIENLLGAASLPDEARERITRAAEGNPLFVEEMVGMLIDDGLLERTNGAWTVSGDLSHLSVPPTIQALLGARLDRLGADERSAIECASVEGKVFHRSAVAELSPEASRPALADRLLALVRKELVRPDQASFTGEEAFRFRHLLIRDAAYDALPKELRAELHERFAGWLERKAGDRAEEYEEILGYHLEQSYRYRTELGPVDASGLELATRAGDRLAHAGQRALQRGDMTAAAPLLSRAHGLLPAGSGPRLELAPRLGEVLTEVGEFSRAEAVLAEAAQAVGDPVIQLRAEMELLYLRGLTGGGQSGAEIVALTERAIPVFEAAGDEAALARAWHLRSDVDWLACRWERRAEALERVLVHARRAGDTPREAEALAWISLSLFFGPAPAQEALRRCEELLATATARVSARIVMTISGLQAMLGRFEEARRLHRDASRIYAELGLTVRSAGTVSGLAFVERLAGDLVAAERGLRQGYETLAALGEKFFFSTVAGELGRVLFEQGRYEEAGRVAEAGRAVAGAEDIMSQVLWRLTQGRLCAVRGEPEEAERLAREAVALIEATDMLQYHGEALMALAEILRHSGRREEAASAVEDALRLFERKGNVVSAAKARAALAELGPA